MPIDINDAKKLFKYTSSTTLSDLKSRHQQLMNKYKLKINIDNTANQKIQMIEDAFELLVNKIKSKPKINSYFKYESTVKINNDISDYKLIEKKNGITTRNESFSKNNLLALEDIKK